MISALIVRFRMLKDFCDRFLDIDIDPACIKTYKVYRLYRFVNPKTTLDYCGRLCSPEDDFSIGVEFYGRFGFIHRSYSYNGIDISLDSSQLTVHFL